MGSGRGKGGGRGGGFLTGGASQGILQEELSPPSVRGELEADTGCVESGGLQNQSSRNLGSPAGCQGTCPCSPALSCPRCEVNTPRLDGLGGQGPGCQGHISRDQETHPQSPFTTDPVKPRAPRQWLSSTLTSLSPPLLRSSPLGHLSSKASLSLQCRDQGQNEFELYLEGLSSSATDVSFIDTCSHARRLVTHKHSTQSRQTPT